MTQPRSCTFQSTNRRDFLYKALIWLEKLTFRFSDVVMSTNNSYKDIAITRGGHDPEGRVRCPQRA